MSEAVSESQSTDELLMRYFDGRAADDITAEQMLHDLDGAVAV